MMKTVQREMVITGMGFGLQSKEVNSTDRLLMLPFGNGIEESIRADDIPVIFSVSSTNNLMVNRTKYKNQNYN